MSSSNTTPHSAVPTGSDHPVIGHRPNGGKPLTTASDSHSSTATPAESHPSQDTMLYDDADVQEYMNRLLQRASNIPAKPASQSEPEPAVAQATLVTVEPVDDRWEPHEFLPKSIAPETNSGLSALREVAMESQRSAMETSARRRMQANSWKYLAITLAPLSFGVLFLSMSARLGDFAMIACAVCFLGAVAPMWLLWKSAKPLTKEHALWGRVTGTISQWMSNLRRRLPPRFRDKNR